MTSDERECGGAPSRPGARGGAAGRGKPWTRTALGATTCATALLSLVFWSHGDAGKIAEAHAATATMSASALGQISQSRVLPWPLETVWPTAVRYLRVDRRYTIVDRDPESGFVMFEFPLESSGAYGAEGEDTRKGHGSLELFATTDASGRVSARAEVTVEGGPSYLPHTILDGLHAKLRDERGPPPPPPPKPAPPKGPKKPRGPDPDGPPDDPGQDPTPEPTPDPPPEPDPNPDANPDAPPGGKRRARPL